MELENFKLGEIDIAYIFFVTIRGGDDCRKVLLR
jgi:hypothetical protein